MLRSLGKRIRLQGASHAVGRDQNYGIVRSKNIHHTSNLNIVIRCIEFKQSLSIQFTFDLNMICMKQDLQIQIYHQ